MGGIIDLLSRSAPLLLFTVIGLGWFLGNLPIGGVRLGIAAVLFVGLFFGAIDPGNLVIPEFIYVLGLILFVYTIGLQSGPIFFNLFRRQWLRLTGLALVSTVAAAAFVLAAGKALGIGSPVIAGLFCGGLTNTPAFAAAVEALRAALSGSTIDPAELRLALDGPTVGYSVAYPFGVLGVILAMQAATKLLRLNLREEDRRSVIAAGGAAEDLLTRQFRLTNPQLIGRSFGEAQLTELTGMVFTRFKRGGEIGLVLPELDLREGDVLSGVGSREALLKAELLIGPPVEVSVDTLSPEIDYRDLVVINRGIVGRSTSDLAVAVGHPVIVSRIRRGGVNITPHPSTTLELGDQVRVVTRRDDLQRVTELVGDPLKEITETDFLSFSLGLILGVLVGMIPIPFFGGRALQLGFAGGPLIVGLILGRLGRTGRIVWTMPANANLSLRQLGILLFLAGVGTRAGGSFVRTFLDQGAVLLLLGAGVTLVSSLIVLLVARRVLRYDMVSTYGILAGIHTQPAALAFANTHTGSESPNVSYTAVYPIALMLKIILAQLLVVM